MRGYLQSNPFIPDEVMGYIKTVIKTQNDYNGGEGNKTQSTSEKLWIPSLTEVGLSNSTINGTENESVYGYFNSTTRQKSERWWLRSALHDNGKYFCCVNDKGNSSYYLASGSNGVVLGFCI